MPVSIAPKDAGSAGFGIQEGDVRVVGARYKIHQYQANKTTGEQAAPFPCLSLTIQLLQDGKAEGDPEEVTWKAGNLGKFAPSEDGESKVGEDVGDEGPYLVALKDGAVPDKRCALMLFTTELVRCGFKESVLEEGNAESLVGLEGHVVTKKQSGSGEIKDWNVLVFDKVTSRPYEKGKAKSGGSGEKKKAAAEEGEGAGAGAGSDNGAADAVKILSGVLGKLKPKIADAESYDKTQLRKAVVARVVQHPQKLQKSIMALFDDDDQLEALADDAGIAISKKGVVTA